MPCEYVSFSLKPFGFFTANPALDLPFDANAASTLDPSCCAKAQAPGVDGHATAHAEHANGHAEHVAPASAAASANGGMGEAYANGHINAKGHAA